MTRVRYTGVHPGTLLDYTDLATGRALTVVPGRVYDVTPASGRAVPEMPVQCVALDYDTDWRPSRLVPADDGANENDPE